MTKLKRHGIHAYTIALKEDAIIGSVEEFLGELEVLVINVPPAMRREPIQSYSDKMLQLYEEIKKSTVSKILFVSSTSVYGDNEGEITEEDATKPVTNSARHLVESERIFRDDSELKTTVVRFGGLIGPDRHPVNYLAGRSELTNGDDAVNLIHLTDCIHIICQIIENNWWNEIFNAVYPDHPMKSAYYREEALKRGLQPPTYKGSSGQKRGKIIKSKNFLNKGGQFYTSIHS